MTPPGPVLSGSLGRNEYLPRLFVYTSAWGAVMTRRTAFWLGLLGGTSIVAGALTDTRNVNAAGPGVGVARFDRPLRVPPVLEPVSRANGQDLYDIVQHEADQEI